MDHETREYRIQAFLANQAFQRSFEVFDTYQQLLAEHSTDETKLKEIQDRMRLVFQKKDEADDEQKTAQNHKINKIFDAIFSLLEKGGLSKEKLAEIFSESAIAEQLLDTWNPKPGAIREKGKIMINEVLEYSAESDRGVLDINIVPSNARGEEVWTKVSEGLHALAKEIEHGTLQHIQTIRAQSWLFSSPFFKDKLQAFLGNDATFEDMPPDDGDTAQVQKLALSYHRGTLKEFLLNGTLPKVERLQMDKKKFLEKFL